MVNQSDSALCFVCLIGTGEQDFFSAQFLDLICKLALWNPNLKAFQNSIGLSFPANFRGVRFWPAPLFLLLVNWDLLCDWFG